LVCSDPTFSPDVAVGAGDFYLPQIGRLQGFPSIVMTDTENVRHDAVLTFPFASHILTPSCFWKDLGKKHIRYFSKRYLIPIPPEKIHDALYYADLLYGESSTMASEAACLGTPAIYIDDVGRGYTDEEEKKYGLVFNFSASSDDQEKSIEKATEILTTPGIEEEWQKRRDRMLGDKMDLTAFMVWFIEEYPESAKIMRDDPDYQYNFRSADYADYTD